MLIQKGPEETSPKEFHHHHQNLQMGQILIRSSGSSKTCSRLGRLASYYSLLFLLLLSSGTWLRLVGAISTELPLNLNANVSSGGPAPGFSSFPNTRSGNGGDELGGKQRDIFPPPSSNGVTDHSTSSASKFISNGQFQRSPLTEEEENAKTAASTTELSTISSLHTTTTLATTAKERPIIQRPLPKPTKIIIQGEPELNFHQSESSSSSPAALLLSPIVVVQEFKEEEYNANELKSNLRTPQQPLKKEDVFEVVSSFSSFTTPQSSSSSSLSSLEETKEKPRNINLLRKLWSSTRSSKLNLTHEHQSLLRIESEKSNRSSSSTTSSSSGSDDKKGTNSSGSRSLLDTDLSSSSIVEKYERESSPATGVVWNTTPLLPTTITTTSPSSSSGSFISSTFGPKLTSLQPTSLKLGQHEEEEEEGEKDIPTSSFPVSDDAPPPESPTLTQTPQPQSHHHYHSSSTIKQATFNDGTELSTSIPPITTTDGTNTNATTTTGPRDNKFPKPGGRRAPMLYPEWLSSGGVYPDDSTNGTGEYYGEPAEYENLINNNENKGEFLGNLGEREEEGPGGRRIPYSSSRRIHADFLERFANISSWQNRLRLREQQQQQQQQVMMGENRMAAAAVSADINNGGGVVGSVLSTETPEAIIAQNGLADVISRGRIDSVMYVYFGDRYNNDYHKEEVAGRVIQAVGGVIAAIAQVLTVLGFAKCVRKSTQSNQGPPIHLHIGFALLISNLLLLLAVHATEPADVCATVAMILHYLHLVIGCWLFAHTMRTYLKLRRHAEAPDLISSESTTANSGRPSLREVKRPLLWSNNLRYCSASWTAPLPFIFMSYLANPDGYETRHYCWMSIEKGMVISFIVPVFLLIGFNTFLVVLSLRHLLAQRKLWADSASAEMDEDTLDERKISNGIRASAMLLPLLAIMWFLGVVALENASSIFFQIASASTNIALSWLVLYFLGDEMWPELCCCCARRDQSTTSSLFSTDDGGGGCHSVQPGAHLSFDNEPLLAASSHHPVLQLPSTSSTITSSAYGIDVGHSVCKPVATSSSSASTCKNGLHQSSTTGNGMYAPILSGPSSSSARTGKRQHKSSKRPNWSTPGGSEIYELKMDSISTICT